MRLRPSSERAVLAWILRTTRAFLADAGEPGRAVDRLWIYWHRGLGLNESLHRFRLPPVPIGQDEGLPGRVARTNVAILCQDVRADEFFSPFYEPIFPDTRAQWCFPLLPELHPDPERPWLGPEDARPVLCMESTTGEIPDTLRRRGKLLGLLGGLRYAVWTGFQKLDRAHRPVVDETESWRLERQLHELAGLQPEPALRRTFDLLVDIFGSKGLSYWQYNRDEDDFCHPIFSTRSRGYRSNPRPGPWGIVGRILANGRAQWVADVSTAAELKPSQFVTEQAVRAAAYIPARRSRDADDGDGRPVEGLLFVNFATEHRFPRLEKDVLSATAEAVASVLSLRSRARRHRLRYHVDLDQDLGEPPSSQRALNAVLETLCARTDYSHAAIYVRDRPGSVLVRTAVRGKHAQQFKGRYLESHPLLGHLNEDGEPLLLRGEQIAQWAGAPEIFENGEACALPLRRGDDLLGICLLAHEGPPRAGDRQSTVKQFREVLVSLLELGLNVHSLRRSLSLLARFLRSSEAARGTSLAPLVEAHLDALLEGSTADACCVLLPRSEGEIADDLLRERTLQIETVSRGDIGGQRPLQWSPVCREVWADGRPRFDQEPAQEATATGHPDVRAQAVVPLHLPGRRLGVLTVEYHTEHLFTREDRWFFQLLAHQLAEAVGDFEARKVLFDRVGSLAASGARIAQLGSPELRSAVPLAEESRALALQAKELSGAEFVDLYVLHGEGLFLQATAGGPDLERREQLPDGRQLDAHIGLVGLAVRTKETVIVPDTRAAAALERGYIQNPAFEDTRSELIVPVIDDNKVIAVINLESRRVDAFNKEHGRFVEAIAAQAVALRRAEELQTVRRQLQLERDLLIRINAIAQKAENEPQAEVLEKILLNLQHFLPGQTLAIHLLGFDGKSFDADRSVRVPPLPLPVLPGADEPLLLSAVQHARQNTEDDYAVVVPAGAPGEPARLVAALGRGSVLGVLLVTSADTESLEQRIELVRAAVLGICNALELAADADRKAATEFRERLLRDDADDLLQLITSTVLHDAPQLVEGLKNSHAVLKHGFERSGQPVPDSWPRIEATLERLGRLLAALPSHNPERIDLVEIVYQTFAPQRLSALPYSDHCQVVLHAADPPTPLYIYESRNWLKHILENLAVNAFRAMAESAAVAPRLTVRAFAHGDQAVVQVEDNGPGMPPHIAEKVGKDRISHQGAPERLGIFHRLARQHVRRQGGETLLVHNTGGCLFELSYPLMTSAVPLEARHGTNRV